MWLNYAFHSKHLLFSQSPLLLVSHLQEDEFSVIIWNAEEFYTKMKLSMWGIVRDCSQQPSEEKLSLCGKTGRVFGFYFLIVHLSLFTLPMVLFTNPANESVLFTKAGVSIFILNSYLFLIMMTRTPDELGFLTLCYIRATTKWSLWRAQWCYNPSCLDLCPALQFNRLWETLISLRYRNIPSW